MRTLGTIAAGLALLVGGVVVWWKVNYPTYTYRYRLTLAIEVDGKVHTGSSVIEVAWETGPDLSLGGVVSSSVRGQGVFIDLGPRGAVVATLLTGETSEVRPDGSQAAIWLAARAFENPSALKDLPALERLQGRRELTPNNMPRLIWFSDAADPKTARKLRPDDIPMLLGPGARLAAAYVEITRDPIVIDIDKKLPWFTGLAARQRGKGIFGRPGEFQLVHSMFVGDG